METGTDEPTVLKRELSPARADDASVEPAPKKVKSEAQTDGGTNASEGGESEKPNLETNRAPVSKPMTEEEKLAAAAAKIKEQTERTAKAAAIAAKKEADKIESKIAQQLTRGQEDKLKRAMKQLAAALTHVGKCVVAKEAAEAKAIEAGVSRSDLSSFLANKGKGGAKGKSIATLATQSVQTKSTADILREPECPCDDLPAHLTAYEGDARDRQALMAWKKAVEKFKDRADRDRDAFVARRKKELKATAARGNQSLQKLLADVVKKCEVLEKANAAVAKAQKELEAVREQGSQLQETLAMKARLAREKFDAKNAVALAALDQKLAKMEGRKLDEAKATVEREAARERERREAREAREAQRRAEKQQRDAKKEEEKRLRALAREDARLKLRKKKEDAIKHKQRLAKYPIPDVDLAAEFEEEAREKKCDVVSLGYKPLPVPTPVPDDEAPFLANEAALADFLNVFGDALRVPKGLGTVKGVHGVISGCGDDLVHLYRALLKPCMEIAVLGKGRNAQQWRRVASDATWPEIVRRVLERKKVGGAGCEALGRSPWQQLSVSEHVFALRGLADLALGGEKPRAIIAKRLEEAQALRYARILEYNAEAQRRRALENQAKEKRKAIRAEAAAKRRAENEKKREAREAAVAAGEDVEDEEEEDDDEEEEEEEEAGDPVNAGEDDDDDPALDDDDTGQEENDQETEPEDKKHVRTERKTREPSPEPTFELPKHLLEYDGHPEDRKALMAWRAEHNKVSAQLEIEKREYEKRKRAELRKQQEKERAEKLRREEAEEAKRLKIKADEERKEKEARKKEAKRIDEDHAVSVRTKPLGKDRADRTYWWGVGGMKGVVYVEDVGGNWGVLSTRKEMDELMDALHSWGNHERALKQALHRRIHTVHAEFRKRARTADDAGGDENGKEDPEPELNRGPGGGPDVQADESFYAQFARERLISICALAESAARVRSDGTLGNPDGSLWRDFRVRLGAESIANAVLASILADIEEALRAGQVREFMDPVEAEARAAAAEAGEEYESDEEEEFLDDDAEAYDDEQVFGDARDQETYESKSKSGMIYPIFDTKLERNKWREAVVPFKNAPASSLAFSVATLEDAAAPFLRALIKHPR